MRLTPYAWAKLLYLRDRGQTEVGGFGVSHPGDLLLVEDVRLVEQRCTSVSVQFADESVADYFDAQVDKGLQPAQFGRIWIHTHPGDSPLPSCMDEETFERCFGSADWALMLIVARGGQVYARLRLTSAPGGQFELPIEIDFGAAFPAANPVAWEAEYQAAVTVEPERRSLLLLRRQLDDLLPWPRASASEFGDRWSESLDADTIWEPINAPSEDRFARQQSLVPRDKLEELNVSVIGVGAIGRQVAIQLAALGIRKLTLIDFDKVEPTNVTTQGYLNADVGQAKVEATARMLRSIDPTIELALIEDRFRPHHRIGDCVFCCVDSIGGRAAIWKAVGRHCRCWIDGRMLGEVMRILVATDRQGRDAYDRTLFQQTDAQTGACTARGIIFTAAIAAGLMLHQFTRWLRDLPMEADVSLNLLAAELIAA